MMMFLIILSVWSLGAVGTYYAAIAWWKTKGMIADRRDREYAMIGAVFGGPVGLIAIGLLCVADALSPKF